MKRYKVKFKVVITTLLLMTILLACSDSNEPGKSIPTYPKDVSIEYTVTPTGTTKVTSLGYTNSTGGDTNLTDVTVPFSLKFDRKVNQADVVSLSVLHNNSASGGFFSLKLEIRVDGNLVKSETFEGTSSLIGSIVYIFP